MIAIRRITGTLDPDSEIIRRLAVILREARREHLQFLNDLHVEDEDRRFLAGLVSSHNQVWGAEVSGTLAGVIAFENDWVNLLYVAPEFQRQGVGTRLLELAKESSPALQLWVFEVNAPAIRFYERHGFRLVERTDGQANEAKEPDVRMEWRREPVEAN